MESLNAASEILTQLKQLTDGMASIRQDVNTLKCESTLQCNTSREGVDNGEVDETADESAPLPTRPLTNNNSGSPPKDTTGHDQSSSWAKEMEVRDPLLDDNAPRKDAISIRVVPVTDRTNKFLNKAFRFTSKMSGANRRSLCSHYTLPQNDLTRAPFLDTMMASECSKTCKSMDRSLDTLQGLILEAIGPLSQLLEAVNDPNPQVSMDQIREAVETAITLLANASNKVSVMRRTRILEEYNKELVTFATAQERETGQVQPHGCLDQTS